MVKSKSGKLFIHYISDKLSFRNGFYATWSTMQRCSEYCKFGTCVNEECVCQEGRYGGDCSSSFCAGTTKLYNRTGAITDHAGFSNYQVPEVPPTSAPSVCWGGGWRACRPYRVMPTLRSKP